MQNLNDWYDTREVFDDEKFVRFFMLAVSINLKSYEELLRMQPGYAQYDWLVTHYRELETKNTGKTSSTTDGTTSSTTTSEQVVNGGSTSTHTGDTTFKKEGEEIGEHAFDSFNQPEGEKSQTTQYGRTDTTSGNLVNGNAEISTRETTAPDSVTAVTEHDDLDGSKDITTEGGKNVTKSSPMSISYSSASAGKIPELDWGSPSAQNQDEKTSETTHGQHYRDTTTHTQTGKETVTESRQRGEETSATGSDTVTFNYAGYKESHKGTDTDTIKFSDRVDTTTSDLTDTTENNQTTKGSTKGEGTSSSTTAGETSGRTTQQETGREGEIADILQKTYDFVKNSIAFEFMRKKVQDCFMGVFEL